jgi:acyl-CoA synthetase (NDP forming)
MPASTAPEPSQNREGNVSADAGLSLDPTVELLGCYGMPLAESIGVVTEDAAVAAAARFGGPVALRADVPGLVRARGAGALLIDLHGADEVRRGFRSLRESFGHRLAGVIVKPIVAGGVEVMISVLQEEVVGPLVLSGSAVRPPMRWLTAPRGSLR